MLEQLDSDMQKITSTFTSHHIKMTLNGTYIYIKAQTPKTSRVKNKRKLRDLGFNKEFLNVTLKA